MTDPISLTVLGSAASQTISFLYAQAAEVLKARRERRNAEKTQASVIQVPIVANEVLDRPVTTTVINPDVVDAKLDVLVRLVGALAPYALGHADIEDAKPELYEEAGTLRAILEATYGQRLTFRNENREPTGSVVTVRQVLGDIEGTVTGGEGDVGPGGHLEVTQQAGTVREGGSITGHRGNIGGT
ncbi:MAG TPA: hypothetical protein VKG80_01470 [Trebonia sp.]|nr:hypothetical protein [Trebonia sp.]